MSGHIRTFLTSTWAILTPMQITWEQQRQEGAQTSHLKGFSPECCREWTFRDMLRLNDFPHVSQVNGMSFVWAAHTNTHTCITRLLQYQTSLNQKAAAFFFFFHWLITKLQTMDTPVLHSLHLFALHIEIEIFFQHRHPISQNTVKSGCKTFVPQMSIRLSQKSNKNLRQLSLKQ